MQLRKVNSLAPDPTADWEFKLRDFSLYYLFTTFYSFSALKYSLVRWKILLHSNDFGLGHMMCFGQRNVNGDALSKQRLQPRRDI